MTNTVLARHDPFLNALKEKQVPVSVFLVNGLRLTGKIHSFDQHVVLLESTGMRMVYRHAISTVLAARKVVRTDRK